MRTKINKKKKIYNNKKITKNSTYDRGTKLNQFKARLITLRVSYVLKKADLVIQNMFEMKLKDRRMRMCCFFFSLFYYTLIMSLKLKYSYLETEKKEKNSVSK